MPVPLPLDDLYSLEANQPGASWQVPSLAPGTQWLPQPGTSEAQDAARLWNQQHTAEGASVWTDPANPGLSLGTSFGTIFSGND